MLRPSAVRTLLLIAATAAAPAEAQVDIAGEWAAFFHEDQPERIPGPDVGDYSGLPLNDAARLKADSWDASVQTLPERQCIPHPSPYSLRGPATLRISKDVDPATQEVVSYTIYGTFGRATRVIWMDGRPHPPRQARHTWAGFSTGRWEGNSLTVETTHIKMGYLRRNGVAHSDLATMTEHIVRHGNHLSFMSLVTDPVFLEEPLVRTTDFVLDLTQQVGATPCDPTLEVAGRPAGEVPHHLPGTNPYLDEFATRFSLVPQAARGGAASTYPEFRDRLRRAERRNGAPGRFPADAVAGVRGPAGDDQVAVLPVQGRVHLVSMAGVNILVSTGPEGMLLVDTGLPSQTERLAAAIRQQWPDPIRFIINTSASAESTGGNGVFSRSGRRLGGAAAGAFGFVDIVREQPTAEIYAHEQVLLGMSGRTGGEPSAQALWPTTTYFSPTKDLFFNDEAIQLVHVPAGHSDGDSLVFFRRSDVLATGKLFDLTGYPVIDRQHGGSIDGLLAGLNRILELAIPGGWQEGGTVIVPARGRLSDEADVVEYRDMITIVRDRVRDMIGRGASLEEVQSARPTREYDGRYGATSGEWTTARFVEAVYRSLTGSR